jgi:putative N6-adenine-specific DNA methylase
VETQKAAGVQPGQQLSQRALERRLKRYVLKASHTFFAPCAPEFEDVLASEVSALPDTQVIGRERGGVTFTGPLDTVYLANLQLRSAHRVLLRLGNFLAQSYPMFFDHARRLAWEHAIGFQPNYSVRVSAKASRLRHHRRLAHTLQAAIAARLAPLGLSPALQDNSTPELYLRLYQDRATLSINTSGEHLHKRGYKIHSTAAPMRETLAASILLMCPLAQHDLIVDPFCGSGTLLVEAWQLLSRVPAGGHRQFDFEALPFFRVSKWRRLRAEALAAQVTPATSLIGWDISAAAVAAARANITAAAARIQIDQADAFALTAADLPAAKRPLLVGNLPYGERLGDRSDITRLYHNLAAHLTRHFAGWEFALVAASLDWLDRRFTVTVKRAFQNGGLPVWLVQGRVAGVS